MVGNGLRQPYALTHAFTVSGNAAVSGLTHGHAVNCFCRQTSGFIPIDPAQLQGLVDKFEPGHSLGKGIELRAITDMAEELFRLVWRETEHTDSALRRTDKAGDQVHQRGYS